MRRSSFGPGPAPRSRAVARRRPSGRERTSSLVALGVNRVAACIALVAALVLPHPAGAQERGVLLVAKPDLADPNFARTVLVVGQDERGSALGVVLNRPARFSLAGLMDHDPRFARFTEPMYRGGPVEPLGLFALFRADEAPGPALRIADDLWLALLPETVERLLADPPAQLRLYVGYAGWAPGQLAAEIERGSWWALDPDADLAFRPDTRALWDELATRASSVRTRYEPLPPIRAPAALRAGLARPL
jgi:putative transcriptional regulator